MWKESVYSFKGNRSRTLFSEVRKNKEEVLTYRDRNLSETVMGTKPHQSVMRLSKV